MDLLKISFIRLNQIIMNEIKTFFRYTTIIYGILINIKNVHFFHDLDNNLKYYIKKKKNSIKI